MVYKVAFLPAARKDLKRLAKTLTREQLQTIKNAADALAEDPRPPGAKAVTGYPGVLRIRAADYRIAYRPKDEVLEVLVIALGDRRDIYERLRRRLSS